MSSLFQLGEFTLSAGAKSNFKIDCDALTESDWDTITAWIAERYKFSNVVGIYRGGRVLANKLKPHESANYTIHETLIVDDVYTTGNSMRKMRDRLGLASFGVVVFSRGVVQEPWIHPIFQMW